MSRDPEMGDDGGNKKENRVVRLDRDRGREKYALGRVLKSPRGEVPQRQ